MRYEVNNSQIRLSFQRARRDHEMFAFQLFSSRRQMPSQLKVSSISFLSLLTCGAEVQTKLYALHSRSMPFIGMVENAGSLAQRLPPHPPPNPINMNGALVSAQKIPISVSG